MKRILFAPLFMAAVVTLGVSTAIVARAQSACLSGWKPYPDLVMKGEGVKVAGMYGQDGATWCASAGLNISAKEVKDLVAGIKDNTKVAPPNGMVAAGVKYVFLRAPAANGILGRKNPTSLLAITSVKALIVVITKDGADPRNITSHEFVANDLIKKGF